jgi:uncharacterized iron-regulated membrane protein
MILIGVSGSVLLVERELLRGSAPVAATQGPYQPLARVLAAAETVRPPDMVARWIELPRARAKPAAVQYAVDQRRNPTFQIYVDPVSLEVLGSQEVVRRGPIATWFMRLHEYMLMPPGMGLRFVGWMAVAMSFMSLTGLILWWPKRGAWGNAFLVRCGARGLRLHLDLHHMAGIWGLVFFLILGLSGIYLAFPRTVSDAARSVLPRRSTVTETRTGPPPSWPVSAEQAIALAQAAVPSARVVAMQLPATPPRLFAVQMETQGLAPSIPPITVSFDPDDPKVIVVDDPRHYAPADRLLNLAYALHFSLGVGPVWSVLVFLTGLLPLVLAVTGVTIWMKKRQARRAVSLALAE